MSAIYNFKDLKEPNFFQRLLKKNLAENFALEVNNLLAKNEILSISSNEIYAIADKYESEIFEKSSFKLNELYSEYLKHCLVDKMLSEIELKELKHLKEILSLTDKDVMNIHHNIVGLIYQKSLNEVVADGIIDKQEEIFLEKLRTDLHLSEDFTTKLSEQVRGQFVQDFFNNIVSDERLSPAEEAQFDLICKNFNVNINIDDKTRYKLDRYKLYWVIENGEIPDINVPLSLEKNERCYFQTICEWYEMRTVTERIDYSGTTVSIKIMKGVRYKVGTITPQRITSEQWKQVDKGTLYLTNKRIILIGQLKNSNIKLQKILSFIPYSDGVELSKDAGRNTLIRFDNNVDICSLILSRLLNE